MSGAEMKSYDSYERIVSISRWDATIIHFFSFVFGLWVLLKRLLLRAWKPKEYFIQQKRDTPPECLVDSSLGQHSYVKLKGVKLHYVECGGRDRPLLLLLHGFPDFWLSWRYQFPILSKYYRTVALDLKGFGDSDKPVWRRSYKVDTLVAELREFIFALGARSCTIMGHDLGALLGWYFIHQYPELVNKFVAVSCPHPNVYWNEVPRSSTFNTRWIQFSQVPYLPEMDALKDDISIINQCFNHLDKDKEPYVEAYKYAFSRKEDWTGPINYFRNLPFSRVTEDGEVVQVPGLLVMGNRDQYTSLESMVKSTDYLEKFSLKIVDGAGHFPHQECPEMFNKFLVAFLIVPEFPPTIEKASSKGIMTRMFGAVRTTVTYGNQVLDVVQKTTNGMVTRTPARLSGSSSN